MSIVAYRDGVIASDTAVSSKDALIPNAIPKIMALKDNTFIGAVGDAVVIQNFFKKFSKFDNWSPILENTINSSPLNIDNDEAMNLIMIKPDGVIKYLYNGGWLEYSRNLRYFAIGSGKSFALGSLYAGSSAIDAVRASIEFDFYCGGDVVFIRRPYPS